MTSAARNLIAAPLLCAALLLLAAGCRTATPDATSGTSAASPPGSPNADASAPEAAATPASEAARLIAEGRRHFEEYRNDEAIALFRRAAEIEPDNGEAHYRLGLALADAGDEEAAVKSYERAAEIFEKAVRDNEDDIALQRLLAQTYSKLDKHAEAVKAYRQVARLAPDESYNHYELGVELMKLAQYPEAAQALKRATELDPDDFRAAEAYDRAKEGVRRRDLALKKQEDELRRQTGDSDAQERPSTTGGRIVPTLPTRPTPVPAPAATPAPKTP